MPLRYARGAETRQRARLYSSRCLDILPRRRRGITSLTDFLIIIHPHFVFYGLLRS